MSAWYWSGRPTYVIASNCSHGGQAGVRTRWWSGLGCAMMHCVCNGACARGGRVAWLGQASATFTLNSPERQAWGVTLNGLACLECGGVISLAC